MNKNNKFISKELWNSIIIGIVTPVITSVFLLFKNAFTNGEAFNFPTVEKWPNLIANIYYYAPTPFRIAYFGWLALIILYSYSDITDKVHFKLPRKVKEENFKQLTVFILVLFASINHLFFQQPSISSFTIYIDQTYAEIIFLILGFTILAVGFAIIFFSRPIINGYWGPHLYDYEKKEDNKLITKGLYSSIRHPIYLGQILMAIATFLLSNNFIVIFLSIYMIYVNSRRANKEEKHLESIFDNEYILYKEKAGKWFPKVKLKYLLPE